MMIPILPSLVAAIGCLGLVAADNKPARPNILFLFTDDQQADHQSILLSLRKQLESERIDLNDGNTAYPSTNRQGLDFWSAYLR